MRTGIFVVVAFAAVLLASVFFFRQARSFIDKPFPGFLAFENHMVGTFSGFDWAGDEAGLRYHDLIISGQEEGEEVIALRRGGEEFSVKAAPAIFSLEDFLVVFMPPFLSGMAYLVSAIIIFLVGRRMRGIVPFVLFNLGIAYYLLASFDFHTGHHLSWFFLFNFVLFPACMSHFALVFPEESAPVKRHRWLVVVPYVLSLIIFVPYVFTFYHMPIVWIRVEAVAVAYVICSYAFWIAMLVRGARGASRETDRIGARYMLFGQVIAFLLPLTAAIAIFLFGRDVPLNMITPVTVVLPVASLLGIILAKLRNTQLQLVQTEKMASLGGLVAGVAHEINNPTTFIYSNIAMLKEYVSYIKGNLREDAPAFRGEMKAKDVMEDLQKLVDTMAEGADRIRAIVSDLRRFGHSQDDAISKVEVRLGLESTLHLLHHDLSGRIQVHMDVSQALTVTANAGQINQIWMNLLSNAASAIEGPGHIWISAKKVGEKVVVEVRDDGRGIPWKYRDRIFDPFFTTKPEGEGTGLGLAITQQIVLRWKGDIRARSKEGEGTTMVVTLPA